MAATAATPNQEALTILKGMQERETKRDSVIDGLLKLAGMPASKAGVTPEDWLKSQVSKSAGVSFQGNFGVPAGPVSWRPGYRRKSFIGEVPLPGGNRMANDRSRYAGADVGSFGHWLENYHTYSNPRANIEEHRRSHDVLKSYGTEETTTQTVGGLEYVRKTALAESSGVSGGYTVLPTMFSEQLFTLAIEEAIVEPRARQQPLTTRQCTIPALDQVNETFAAVAGQSNLLGGLVMTWVAEAATRKESEPQFRNVVGTAWEGSFYSLASNTLLADNAVGLDNYLTQLFGRAVGWYLDYAYFQGTGVGQPLGVLNTKAAIKVTRQTGANTKAVTYQDLCNMVGKVYWPMRKDSMCWVVHPTAIPFLLLLSDQSGNTTLTPVSGGSNIQTGRLLYQSIDQGAKEAIPAPEGAQSFGTMLGWPVMVSEKVPALGSDGDIGLYDFDIYAIFKRMDIEIAVSTQVAFLQNQTAWRVVVRGDGQPLIGNFLTYADGGATSTASPFIVLH